MSSTPEPLASSLASGDASTGAPSAAAAPPPQVRPIVWISFAGDPRESAAPFIQSVQRIAFLQNRIEDDKWMAQYASTCLTDSALLWYLVLDTGTQSSWVKLRMALVQSYPPAVASQQQPARTSAAAGSTSTKRTEFGRIEVLRPNYGTLFGYLSYNSKGAVVVDPRPEKALKLQKVLHTDSKHQGNKIYSLKLLNTPDHLFPFLGLKLFKFTDEDPDTVSCTDPDDVLWSRVPCLPPYCKMTTSFGESPKPTKVLQNQNRVRFATWKFSRTMESGPVSYYMRTAEGTNQKARAVSAVWKIIKTEKGMEELGLTWPSGDDRRPNGIFEIGLEAVLHNGSIKGLHVHANKFAKDASEYLDESRVVLLFKQIPSA